MRASKCVCQCLSHDTHVRQSLDSLPARAPLPVAISWAPFPVMLCHLLVLRANTLVVLSASCPAVKTSSMFKKSVAMVTLSPHGAELDWNQSSDGTYFAVKITIDNQWTPYKDTMHGCSLEATEQQWGANYVEIAAGYYGELSSSFLNTLARVCVHPGHRCMRRAWKVERYVCRRSSEHSVQCTVYNITLAAWCRLR